MNRTQFLIVIAGLSGCSYLHTASKQAYYAAQQIGAPQQRIYKHMLDRDTFFVFGRIQQAPTQSDSAVAVVAISDRFRSGEVVDVNHASRADSYYGLNLPAGDYRLLTVSDLNRDGWYDEKESLGERTLSLSLAQVPEKVLGGQDIDLRTGVVVARSPFRIAVARPDAAVESVIYPKGTIRSLNDAIFSRSMATIGLYEPAVFMERAPMMFYALEEDLGYKVPVVFMHGIDGSPRDFAAIVARLDRTRYRPWFFYYPSGQSLSQVSEMFYRLFLSGTVIPFEDMPMAIVAHSMGGLVVRDALSRYQGSEGETKVRKLIPALRPVLAVHRDKVFRVSGRHSRSWSYADWLSAPARSSSTRHSAEADGTSRQFNGSGQQAAGRRLICALRTQRTPHHRRQYPSTETTPAPMRRRSRSISPPTLRRLRYSL